MTIAARAPVNDRYNSVAIAFHWTIAAMVILNLVSGLLYRPLFFTHKAIGITVLVLSIGRLLWRLTHRVPPPPADLPRWQQAVARGTHYAFYVLILALPISGWVMSSATDERRPLTWFGLFDIPYLPLAPGPVGGNAHDAHVLLGWLTVALVALHVVAALRHHLILRDHVLGRMLPGVR